MAFEGWIDIRHQTAIGGWASDSEIDEPVMLEIVDANEVVIGQVTANAHRDEFIGRSDARAARSFWFQPAVPLSFPEVVRVRFAGTHHYLPDRPEPTPIPSDDLIYDVVGGRNIIPQFLAAGAANHQFLQRLVLEAKGPLTNGARVLDWGCGCGRVARHWAAQASETEFHGCDIHGEAVAWCSENMPFGAYKKTNLLPPLPYPDNYFDLVYGISVLTHLLFHTHYTWMAEIWRILKPGGIAILTAQGPSMFPVVANEIAKHGFKTQTHAVDTGMFVGVDLGEGANSSGNAVTRDVMEKIFSPFEMRMHRPCLGLMGIQDTYVFYKRSASKLQLQKVLIECPINSTEFRVDIPLPPEPFTKCSVLVAAPGLIYPATIELLAVFEGSELIPITSGPVNLQQKSSWTNLQAAYTSAALGPIPPYDGTLKLVAICRSERLMDGAILTMHNATFF
jgi:SAM-dependent methyltransferase